MTDLTGAERAMLDGAQGDAVALAMRIVLSAARVRKAPRLREITAAHVDGCLYHGPSGLDFVRMLTAGEGRVRVPTTLNVGGLDLLHPALHRGPPEERVEARALMEGYVELGCRPTFTCAPYQLPGRPRYGEHVAWAESNAIVFANSVLGVRTGRYGDFIDICAALTARVPDADLHVEANRAARVVFDVAPELVSAVDPGLLAPLLGHHVGRVTGVHVPAVTGLAGADVGEDWMKAFGAAAASSGGVALFHLVGITPDAPDLDHAVQGGRPIEEYRVELADLERARAQLTTAPAGAALGGVSLGTPHMSRVQLVSVAERLAGRMVRAPMYVSTSRSVAATEQAAVAELERCGVHIVLDTCTYISSIMNPAGAVMTDSAKWAYYAPGNVGFDVVLAGPAECVESAVAGKIVVRELA
jgi:predicted aconitase